MARVTLTPTALVANGGVADPAGTASVAGAGNGFSIPASRLPQDTVFLRVNNGGGATATVTVLAGSQPSALSSGLGPVTVSVAAAGTQWVGPFETARLQQPDGSLAVETSAVLTVAAFQIDGRRV